MEDLFSSTFGSFWHNILPNLDENLTFPIYIVAFSIIFFQIWYIESKFSNNHPNLDGLGLSILEVYFRMH